jgi:15-cis-phytoene synthase
MKALFDEVSAASSKLVTHSYSTSFSLGIKFLGNSIREPIYGIYGFVRLADEIVDSFQGYDKAQLLAKFKQETIDSIDAGISLNPVLNSFQKAVNDFSIEWKLIETFFRSMEMDLDQTNYDQTKYEDYIVGSAEVVGLMCLRVFTKGDEQDYQKLKPAAMSLGAAFQKVNFLRDVKADYEELGRTYFPQVDIKKFSKEDKETIEQDIRKDFAHALTGIKQLPISARKGVYLAYIYYLRLFNKIEGLPASKILSERVRVPNAQKVSLMMYSLLRHECNLL